MGELNQIFVVPTRTSAAARAAWSAASLRIAAAAFRGVLDSGDEGREELCAGLPPLATHACAALSSARRA